MRIHVKHAIKRAFVQAGIYRLNRIANRFYILTFHMVAADSNGFFPITSIRVFEKQIMHLVENYNVVPLDEIVDRLKNGASVRGRVAITFDDGFRDNYENAYPILRKYNVPATIFLATQFIETGAAPWFIKLRYIFMKTDKIDYRTSLNGKSISFQMRTREERYGASEAIMIYFKNCLDAERVSVTDRLCEELSVRDFGGLDNLMLNWSQVREMSEQGISFGAHTVSHPVLATVPLDEAKREISESKKKIEERIGKPVSSFAYPFGKKADYKPEIFPILEKIQFKCAVTTEAGINNYGTSLFELNRFGPWELRAIG